MVFGVYKYGAVGGAVVWIVINILYFFTATHIMHRRILKGEKWKWYFEDLALPFITAILVAGTGKLLLPISSTRFETIVKLIIISALTFLFTAFSTKATRNYLTVFINRALSLLSKNNRILQK
jgi:hypothetical protein